MRLMVSDACAFLFSYLTHAKAVLSFWKHTGGLGLELASSCFGILCAVRCEPELVRSGSTGCFEKIEDSHRFRR